jgi:solute carrier family 13 (sodium-dependent dicarboxylate transporter), member 2/3/5
MAEPTGEMGEDATTPRRRWIVATVVGAAGLIGAVVAPEPWPEGDGVLHVEYQGSRVVSESVTLGDGDPLTVEGNRAGVHIRVFFPGGLAVDRSVEGSVGVTVAGAVTVPALDDVVLLLELPDERVEPIPPLRRDPSTEALVVGRRPPAHSAAVLGLLGVVVVLWVTEAVPLFVTSLAIPVVLVVTGATGANDALSPFFHPIIALFFGGFLMAEAMKRTNLDRLAAVSIVARVGRSPRALFAAMLGLAAFLSMWMSNTAAVALLIPIALAVTGPLESPGYRKAVVLGIAYAATIGGVGSAIGTPANPLAIAFLDDFVGRRVSFVEWFAFGLPMVALFLPIMGAYLWWRYRARPLRDTFGEARTVAQAEMARIGRPNRAQITVLAVFLLVVAIWLLEPWHGLNTGIVAVGGAVLLSLLGKVRPEDLGRISWASLLTFGGGLALGFSLVESGTADWLATRMAGLGGLPGGFAVAAVALFALALTTVASNTAAAATLVPLAIPLGGMVGVDPVLLVIVVAIASSVDFALVIGTPPTMLAYSTRLFTAREIFRTGIILDLVGIILLVSAVTALWRLFGIL